MPIYAYKCGSCGFAKDQLQKIADPALTDCPSCGKPSFTKQLTAAGFQLKGSGWYATDFKGNSSNSPAATVSADAGEASASTATDTESTSASTGGCAPSCACH